MTIGDRVLLEAGELWLERGEHVSLVGGNGAGKTTLIETLAGARPFADDGSQARDATGMAIKAEAAGTGLGLSTSAEAAGGPLVTGKLSTGHNVKIGFLSQHADGIAAGNARTVVEATAHRTGLPPGQARALLGRFLFSGEDADKPLDGLSGGERQRLSLAILVQSGANVLILDEPTNHLDVDSREALEDALSQFTGSLLLVSHDRALLDAVGTRTIALEDQTLHSYVGGWPEYLRVRSERAELASAPKAKAGKAPGGAKAKPTASTDHSKLEGQIEAAEAALQLLEEELAGPEAWSTPERSTESSARHAAAKQAVEELYARYEQVAG
jgi:ATP-binding cassette subfamily F protein 3